MRMIKPGNLRHVMHRFFSKRWNIASLYGEFGLMEFGKTSEKITFCAPAINETISITSSQKDLTSGLIEYSVIIENNSKDKIRLPQIKCLFLSDLHLGKRIEKQKLNALTSYTKESSPNLICIIGDIFDDGLIDCPEYRDFFGRLRELNINIILTTGNHDYCGHSDIDRGKLAASEKFLKEFNLEFTKNKIITLKKDSKPYSLVCLDDIYSSDYSKEDGKALLLEFCNRDDISDSLKEKIKLLSSRKEICPGYFCMTRKYLDLFGKLKRDIPFGILVHSLDSVNHIISSYLEEKGLKAKFIMSGHTHSGEANFKIFPTNFTVSGTFFLTLKGSYFDINDHYCSRFMPIAKVLCKNTVSISNPGFTSILEKMFYIKRFGAFQPGVVKVTIK